MATFALLLFLIGAVILLTLLIWTSKLSRALKLPKWADVLLSAFVAIATFVGVALAGQFISGALLRLSMM